MKGKLRKLVGIILLIAAIIGGVKFFYSLHLKLKQSVSIKSLKETGYLDSKIYTKIIYPPWRYTLRWNDKGEIPTTGFASINENPTLYAIPTTQIPNKDGFLNQAAWKEPKLQSNNVNYIKITSNEDSLTFYVPVIADFEKLTKGYPSIFMYIDSSDFFAADKGVYIPGVNEDKKNIKKGGNYAMRGKEWERSIYFQLFSGEYQVLDEGWCGVRIHGNLTRAAPQKSLRFYSREKYNKEYFVSPFEDTSHVKRFILRSPFSSNFELIYKDAMISEIAIEMDMDAMRSTPVVTFLNGEYWGHANYRDRVDEYFFFENYGIDTVDFVDLYSRPKYGSAKEYIALTSWIQKNDLRNEDNYKLLLTKIDIENYIRYLLIELYFANKDWPHNNVRIWKSSQLDNKWRWLIFDNDATGKDNVDMADHIGFQSSKKFKFWGKDLLLGLMANETFYAQLKAEYQTLRAEELNVTYLQAKADSMNELYLPLLPDQIKRWDFPSSMKHYELMHDHFLDFLVYRDEVLSDELERIHQIAIDYQDEVFVK
jgi:hypothetical protein